MASFRALCGQLAEVLRSSALAGLVSIADRTPCMRLHIKQNLPAYIPADQARVQEDRSICQSLQPTGQLQSLQKHELKRQQEGMAVQALKVMAQDGPAHQERGTICKAGSKQPDSQRGGPL